MIEMSFFTGLWTCFFIVVLASLGIFFSHRLKNIVMASCLALSGICLQIFTTDLFRGILFAQFIIVVLWSLFLFQSLFFRWALFSSKNKIGFFYGLPFLSFIAMAISQDLLTVLLALTTFACSFVGLYALRQNDKKRIEVAIQKLCVSFLSFSYGLACLYAREGTILLKDLYLKLQKGNWDSLTILGVYLLAFSVLIEIYAIIPLIGKKK